MGNIKTANKGEMISQIMLTNMEPLKLILTSIQQISMWEINKADYTVFMYISGLPNKPWKAPCLLL